MDISSYLQCFESRMSSYTGDDPLDPWDKFVDYLEQRLPAGGDSGMSVVLDSLVQRFLNVERYANDVRYVNHCIKCASFYSDPIALYSHVFGKGVGTRTAALYLAWARHFEQKGLNQQADAVYQKATENQAQPADVVLQEYRQFQSRNPGPGVNPLQTSHLTNQMTTLREPVPHSKTVDWSDKPPAVKTTVTVSRSENSGASHSGQNLAVQTVSEYMVEELAREGSELSFEEVRAERYFRTVRQRQKLERVDPNEWTDLYQEYQPIQEMFQSLDSAFRWKLLSLEAEPAAAAAASDPHLTQHASGLPGASNQLSSGSEPASIHAAAVPEPQPADTNALSPDVSHHASVLTDGGGRWPHWAGGVEQANPSLHSESRVHGREAPVQQADRESRPPPALNATHPDVSQLLEPVEKLSVSEGGAANLSHITPNNSLGYIQATPSKVQPSPTVHTQEALVAIMDMFQEPPVLEDPFSTTSAGTENSARSSRHGGSMFKNPPSAAPFTIFQDDNKENSSAAAPPVVEQQKAVRALAEIPASKAEKPNETPQDQIPDESTMWGARFNSLNSLAACPNSTTDFALQAQLVSTPSTHTFLQDHENNRDEGESADDPFVRRQPKKLSPIIEQSPLDDKLSESSCARLVPSSAGQGTIIGEALAVAQHCLTSSSITMVQAPPPAVLSFRDQTLCPTDSALAAASGPDWEVYVSPERPPQPTTSEPFQIFEEDPAPPSSPERAQRPADDVPMSPESPVNLDWMVIRSPEAPAEPDLDAFLSPCPPKMADPVSNIQTQDVPMSPEPLLCADVSMSPAQQQQQQQQQQQRRRSLQFSSVDEAASPDWRARSRADVSVATDSASLVPDPWDDQLICGLLSSLTPPLTSHPRCISWQRNIPSIAPKMTISMGKASLLVDGVLGEGAFATVYQATDPRSSEKMVLKVQKPANPWEFYIHTRLEARLQPDVRRLFGAVRWAHLFLNGSVLLGELHSYGTLLNAVNIYKGLSDKVMPQPLVMYFAVCILHMVEQLHAVHIVHADIKPDNFLLGERFLENKCFDSESVDHGLVLIDLGQSIDMELFPPGSAFTAKCLTSGFQCTEMQSGKPWNYQTDYYGIAGTVYCLLFGTYMKVTNEGGVWKTNAVFRRNPHSALWLQLFHTLLNVPDCSSLPSLRRLREQLASVLQQNYRTKVSSLKNRLVVQLLESRMRR